MWWLNSPTTPWNNPTSNPPKTTFKSLHADSLESFPDSQTSFSRMLCPETPGTDAESLQQRTGHRRRGRCLDACLVASVALLFVAVGAVAAGGVMVVLELRSKLELAQQQQQRPVIGRDAPAQQVSDVTVTDAPAYKMQNFAYLQATSQLKNGTMTWTPVHHGPGQSIGSHFAFQADHHSLQPTSEGSYFLYLEVNLTCTYRCKAGLLTLHVGDKLTCNVELPEWAESTPVNKKCWTVARMDGHKRLVTQMTVSEDGLENWKLERKGSGLGMFLVD